MAEEKKQRQYFIAIIPPSPLYEQALALKNHFREHYNSKASLNSPPHITLHMPFRWYEHKEQELVERLTSFAPNIQPFSLKLSNFDSFPPRVIFINVEESTQLKALQKKLLRFCKQSLNVFNADYLNKPFHPHLTLAFRDLKKSMYAEAWKEFEHRQFSGEFTVDRFALLKHNGKIWQPFQEFFLK